MVQQHEDQQKLIQSITQKNSVEEESVADKKVKMEPYKDGEEIEDFLEMFEGKMKLHQIGEERWLVYLVELLQGRVREAC